MKNFNPLHREGGDITLNEYNQCTTDFNPLHREGGDYFGVSVNDLMPDFNPLHREGGDGIPLLFHGCYLPISIHSTARVETPL